MASPNQSERAVPLVQTVVLAILFAAPALFCLRAANIQDPDVWWHLRTAQWIVEHRAVPFADPFSATAAGEPWAAYSWLFELVLRFFHQAGLQGIIAYAAVMVLAITVATHRLVRRLQRDFSLVILITYAALFSMGELFTPRPWLFTILFFILELDLIFTARRTGRTLPLLWLLPLFAVWANVHVQFIDGQIVLGFALIESIATQLLKRPKVSPAPLIWAALLAGCMAAVCVNPYGWHLYRTAYDLAAQAGVLNKINELAAMPFRSLVNYVALALALGAAAILARASRILIFESLLFAFAVYTGFRSQRDVWILAIASAALIAQGLTGSAEAADRTPFYAAPLAATAAFLALLAGFPLLHVTESKLTTDLAKAMPVEAVAFARDHNLAGPLFNDFTWGGYLIWALHQPVALDGRAALYGDQRIDRNVNTINGQPGWVTDATLSSSRLVIVSPKQPLAQLLRFDSRFRLVHEDSTADVFISSH